MAINIVMIGLPGSGKGTQSKLLAESFSMDIVATGDMLRSFSSGINENRSLSQTIKQTLDKGGMVTDSMIGNMVADLVTRNMVKKDIIGFIFDGFPRNLTQAVFLDKLLSDFDIGVDLVIDLVASDDIIAERLSNRIICGRCASVFNRITQPPRDEGVCDACGSDELVYRADDDVSVVRNRFDVFRALAGDLMEYYRDKIFTVDAAADVAEVRSIIASRVRVLLGGA